MPEKVKLSKSMDTFLVEYLAYKPSMSTTQKGKVIQGVLDEISKGVLSYSYTQEVDECLADNRNLALLMRAILDGYEIYTGPRWGIKAGNGYMNDPVNFGFTDIYEDAREITKITADAIVSRLGFGEVVDLNEEA
ncbi:hypothetical protein ACEN4A_01415 [Latilactobacillus sakei]|uniref:hypothetical protein n=1 Tax=Latilactobacillus sakei TaxID=1599 RepID=UPI00388B8699